MLIRKKITNLTLNIQISDSMICFIECLQNYGKFKKYCLILSIIARTAFSVAMKNLSRHPSKYIFKVKFSIQEQGYTRKYQIYYLLLEKSSNLSYNYFMNFILFYFFREVEFGLQYAMVCMAIHTILKKFM